MGVGGGAAWEIKVSCPDWLGSENASGSEGRLESSLSRVLSRGKQGRGVGKAGKTVQKKKQK